MSDNYNTSSDSASDTFTETTTTSWLSRIGQSIAGVLFGTLLIIGSIIGLFWNEGRAVQTARSLAEGQNLVVNGEASRVDPLNEGKLVHVSGDLKTTAPLADPDFGISANAARLIRVVSMYQWKEETKTETQKNPGGSETTVTTYNYVRGWSESWNDSSKFKRPDGHANPQFRYQRLETTARDGALGAFRPGERVLQRLSADRDLLVDPAILDKLRAQIGGPLQVADGGIYLGADPAQPRIGDLRITYRIAPVGPVSLVGRQTGVDFAEYQTQAGDRLLLVSAGTLSPAEMFKAAHDANRVLTWIIRAVGAGVMWIGFALILRPLSVIADVIPFLGNIVGAGASFVGLLAALLIAPTVIAIAWLLYRPLVSVIVLAGALAAVLAIKMLGGRRTAARPMPAGAGSAA